MLQNDDPLPAPDTASAPVWSARREGIGVALWASFIVAGLEAMLIFAFLDPISLDGVSTSWAASRPLLYGCGFFLLWLFTFLAAGLTAYMLESGPHTSRRRAASPIPQADEP